MTREGFEPSLHPWHGRVISQATPPGLNFVLPDGFYPPEPHSSIADKQYV